MIIERIAVCILGLLMVGTVSIALGQDQPASLSDEDEAEIVEYLLQHEIKPFGSWFGSVTYFSSENLSRASASRIKKHGFSLIAARDIETMKREYVIDYVIIRSIYLRSGIVVVRVSAVSEGRPCFAPPFSTEQRFTYTFRKVSNEWVGRLLKGPVPFPFRKSLATTR